MSLFKRVDSNGMDKNSRMSFISQEMDTKIIDGCHLCYSRGEGKAKLELNIWSIFHPWMLHSPTPFLSDDVMACCIH